MLPLNAKPQLRPPLPAAGGTTSGQRRPRPARVGLQSWNPWRTKRWTCYCVCCQCWRTTGGSPHPSRLLLIGRPEPACHRCLCFRLCLRAKVCAGRAACLGGCHKCPSETPPLNEGRVEAHHKCLHCHWYLCDCGGQEAPRWGGNHNATGGSVRVCWGQVVAHRRCLPVYVWEAEGSRSSPPEGRGWSCREAPSRSGGDRYQVNSSADSQACNTNNSTVTIVIPFSYIYLYHRCKETMTKWKWVFSSHSSSFHPDSLVVMFTNQNMGKWNSLWFV